MGALGLYLLVKTANERQLRIIPVVTNLLKGIKFRLHGQGRT